MIQIVLDGCLVALSYMLAWWIRFRSVYFDFNPVPEEGVLPMDIYFSAMYYLVPAYLVLYFLFSLYYVPRRMALFRYEFLNIVYANIVGLIGFIIVAVVGHTVNFLINALGSFVHASRLQYVEFFGKFYEGGGTPFRPLERKTKYVKIQNDK